MGEKHQCAKWVFSGERWDCGGHACRKGASYFEDNKWWCKIHAPSVAAKREANLRAKWDAENAAASAASARRARIEELRDECVEVTRWLVPDDVRAERIIRELDALLKEGK